MNHSKNCQCYDCTEGDPHIAELRSRFGRNAVFSNDFAARGGVYGSLNDFDRVNHLSTAPLQTMQITSTINPIPTTPGITPQKANLKDILGDALGSFVGDLIQAKKDGQVLPKALDTVATLGIKTEQAAMNAAQKAAEQETGKQVLKFSPFIIAGVIGAIVLILFLVFKR